MQTILQNELDELPQDAQNEDEDPPFDVKNRQCQPKINSTKLPASRVPNPNHQPQQHGLEVQNFNNNNSCNLVLLPRT